MKSLILMILLKIRVIDITIVCFHCIEEANNSYELTKK